MPHISAVCWLTRYPTGRIKSYDGANQSRPRLSAPRVAGIVSNSPRVSIVICFLNAQALLRESIESVFSQTFDAWELLLVDDGSTDALLHASSPWRGQQAEVRELPSRTL